MNNLQSENVLIYFHANAEDLGLSYDFLLYLQENLNINVLGIEYPGYGVYEGSPSEKAIFEDSEQVIRFVTKQLKFSMKNIYLLGRSMGTGPVCHLASKYQNLAGVILVSPFLSIRSVAKRLVGNLLSFLVKDW